MTCCRMGALVLTCCHEGTESSHNDEALKGDVQVSWSAADAAIKALYRALTRAHNLTSRHLMAVADHSYLVGCCEA